MRLSLSLTPPKDLIQIGDLKNIAFFSLRTPQKLIK